MHCSYMQLALKKDWIYLEYNVSWKLVFHLKSTKETFKLREKQSMLKLPTHAYCVTRWGSTLSMLERLMEQQAVIAAVLV